MRLQRDILSASRVMVVGCGALGNEVLKNLALCGVGHIVCVDFDIVEERNLSRSVLFRIGDAAEGRPKVYVAAERLREIAPSLDVCAVNGDITADVGLGLVRDVDVVAGCVDSRWARFMINRHCMRMNRPWVDGGISLSEGTVRVFEPGRNCYACGLDETAYAGIRRRISCSNVIRKAVEEGIAPSTSISASVVGAVEAQEVLRIICGESSMCGRMFFCDGDSMSFGTAAFSAYDGDCPEHDMWSPVEKLPLSFKDSVKDALACLPGENAAILLRDDRFVDFVESRTDGCRYRVMLPKRRIRGFDDCYADEYMIIDKNFPYQDMSLESLGIPDRDVVRALCDGKERYFELQGK